MIIIGEVLVPLSTLREAYARIVTEAEARVEAHRLERLAEISEIETRWSNIKAKFTQVFDWVMGQYEQLGDNADRPGQKLPPEITTRDLSAEIAMSEHLYDLLRRDLDEKRSSSSELRYWESSYGHGMRTLVIRKPSDWNRNDEDGRDLAREMHAAKRELDNLPTVGRGMRLNIVRAEELEISYLPEDVEWRFS